MEEAPAVMPWNGSVYRMPDVVRDAAVKQLTESVPEQSKGGTGPSGLDVLRRELGAAAEVMRASDKVQYDPVLARWSEVAAHAGSDAELAAFLDAKVVEALDRARQADTLAAPDALRWIEAVEPFAQLFRGTLPAAITIARGKRELFYRRADDERRLRHYYPPPKQTARPAREEAFGELLGDAEHWALHYVGGGGGGKTMLLRYIANRLAPQAGVAVARVDFDFLNPDYPSREPGMLLARFADELRLQAGQELEAFTAFDAALASLNEWIGHERAAGHSGVATVEDARFRRTIDAFARGCLRLNRPVLLMLDTCEELAKLRPDGTAPDSVKVTFDVLETLHASNRMGESLRVIFSGRRALASSGFGWTAPGSPLPARPYLRLHCITGFDAAEARGFLEAYSTGDRTVPRELHDHILRLSLVSTPGDEAARFQPVPPDVDERFNPYDVSMYASWATSTRQDEPLSPEQLERAGPHFYIEERIARRLAPDVWRVLPALTLLGRFDRRLLDTLVAASGGGAGLADEMVDQEWIRPDRGAAGDTWVMEGSLHERLLRYLIEIRPADVAAGRRLLAGILPALTLARPFAELNERYFAATLDALGDRPDEAAEWWLKVEQRILDSGQWEWALQLVSVLLAEPGLAEGREKSFRAAVLALQAAALLHTKGDVSESTWRQAGECFTAYPASFGREALLFRIQCARHGLYKGDPPRRPAPDDRLWGSLAAAMEAVVERREGEGRDPLSDVWLLQGVGQLARAPDVFVRAFGLSLQARLEMSVNQESARAHFREAAQLADGAQPRAWLDWLPPDSLLARVQLEAIRATDVDPAIAIADADQSIDGDRLRALRFQREDDVRAQVVAMPVKSLLTKPRCRAHRLVSPLEIVQIEAFARHSPARALARLQEIAATATTAGLPDVAIEAERSAARTIRRHRLLSEGYALPPAIVSSTDPSDVRIRVFTRALHLSFERAAEAVANQDNTLPPRRAARRDAEALLEWAEIAQLYSKDAGEGFEQAARLLDATGDEPGRNHARIAHAGWLARNGRRNAVAAALDGVAFPAPVAELMDLEAAIDADGVAKRLDAVGREQRPWMVRAVCAHLAAQGTRGLMRRRAVLEWVARHYVTEIDGDVHLPFEIVTAEAVTAASFAGGRWKQIGERALVVLGGVIGLAMLAGLVYGVWRVSGSFAEGVLARGLATAVLLFGGVWFLTQGIPLLGRGYSYLFRRIFRLTWTIRLEADPEDIYRPLTAEWTLRIDSRLAGFVLQDGQTVRFGPTREERYAHLAASIPRPQPGPSPMMLRLMRSLGLYVDARVVTDSHAAAAPWEAVFGLPSPEVTSVQASPFHVVRGQTARRRTGQSDWVGSVTILVWDAGSSRIGSGRGWTGDPGGTSTWIDREIIARHQFDTSRPDAGVVHVVGTPSERRGEVFLQIGGQKGDDPYLLEPGDLARRYAGLRLLVVQAPFTQVLDRTPTDRLEAAWLKRFAAQAFQSGIPAVFVVPPLPPELEDVITHELHGVLAAHSRKASRQLIAAHRRIQQQLEALLARNDLYPAEGVLESVLDVCVFIDDDLNFRVRPGSPEGAV